MVQPLEESLAHISLGGVFVFQTDPSVFQKWSPNLEMKDQLSRGGGEGLSVFSLQFLLMIDFKNSVISPRKIETEILALSWWIYVCANDV